MGWDKKGINDSYHYREEKKAMVYEKGEIIRDVRRAIDMNSRDERLLSIEDEDTLELEELICSKIEDGVRIVELEAPAHLLESGHDMVRAGENAVFMGDDGKGFLLLPKDFMRLVAFRMSDWKRTVFEAISEGDPRYLQQSSRWPGICGNPEKPVVAIVRRSEGMVLEFYSCRDPEAVLVQATYIPRPRLDKGGRIDISEGCYRAAVCKIAALVLASYGDSGFQVMNEMSASLLR